MVEVNRITEAERLPPHSLEAERAVLGTMIVDNSTIPRVEALLLTEDFYRTEHQIIYETIIALYHRDGSVDLTTLCDELERTKVLDKVGGPGYVAGLEDYVITSANIEHHSRIVFNKSKLRKLIDAAYTIADQAFNEVQEPEDILENSEKLIFEIARERAARDFVAIGEITADAVDEISQKYQHKQMVTGLPTGYPKLDNLLSGLQPSDLIIVAGRPSVGKTAFALNVALNVARQKHCPVGIFSLEMSSSQINHRLLCTLSQVSGNRVRTGYLSGMELKKITEKAKLLSSLPIYIDDTPGLTAIQLRARAHRLKALEPELGLIVIDYLQLMHSGTKADNRQQEVTEISHSLKSLARELGIPVMALSQLSRMVERRKEGDKRPVLSDLRESGAIEQDADVVLFVHRPELDRRRQLHSDDVQSMQSRPEPGEECEIIIGKQRNGPLGIINLIFFPDFTLFAQRR
ncbi:replicative DNA helicase [Candidatus Sumerlaeota bacterium]|nr:replicative DNA helicase [Candidatus Sumerlaeota bacterium]